MSNRSSDFDERWDRDLEREPTYRGPSRPRIKQVESGTLRTYIESQPAAAPNLARCEESRRRHREIVEESRGDYMRDQRKDGDL